MQEFLRAADRLAGLPGDPPVDEACGELQAEEAEFRAAMDDDFNTAKATGVLFDLVREGNRLLHAADQGRNLTSPTLVALRRVAMLLRRLGGVLGLDLRGGRLVTATLRAVPLTRSASEAQAELGRLLQATAMAPADLEGRLVTVLQELLAHREAARGAKAWAEADQIRQALSAHGFRIEDTRTATHAISEFVGEQRRSSIDVTLVKA